MLGCASSLFALRTLRQSVTGNDEFIQKRRQLKATLYALKDEGQLFLRVSGNFDGTEIPPAPKAVHELTHGKIFRLPTQEYDAEGVRDLRRKVRAVIDEIQDRVSDYWAR